MIKLSDATDQNYIGLLAPEMQKAIRFVRDEAQRILDERDPGLYSVRIGSTYRSPGLQEKLFQKGRKLVGDAWVVVDKSKVVTNARAGQSPHNIVASDGLTPAALAADIWILSKATGGLIKDSHLAWAVIPFAAHVAPIDVESGAFFPIRDWPHVQLAEWKTKVKNGRLIE